MKNVFRKSSALVSLALLLTACASSPAPEETTTPVTETPAVEEVTWLTYAGGTENPELAGFTMQYPEMVLADSADPKSLVKLNVFTQIGEMPITKGAVYFTTHSLEDTVKNSSWDFRVGVLDSDELSQVIPFLESFYEVKGCEFEFNKDETTGFTNIGIAPADATLTSDEASTCFIGGKVVTTYDEVTGKLITYNLVEPFFYQPGGDVSEQALASLKFEPTTTK